MKPLKNKLNEAFGTKEVSEGSEIKNAHIEITRNLVSFSIPSLSIEIEGVIRTRGKGRSEVREFEPNYFENDESSKYYDSNWEDIETAILNKS